MSGSPSSVGWGVQTLGKKTPAKKGFWWLSDLKFNNNHIKEQSLAATSAWGPLTQTALHREACTEAPACTSVFLPSEPLWRSSWNLISNNRIEVFPIQLDLPSSDQTEWLYSDQSAVPSEPIKL